MIENKISFFDDGYPVSEQFPRKFEAVFTELVKDGKKCVQVTIEGNQIGDVVTDNSYQEDFYRFHDVFHYTNAAVLGWSACARAMMKRKRKSNPLVDEVEDGARAQIAEEAICGIIFAHARNNNYFRGQSKVDENLLAQIRDLTFGREVYQKTEKDWENSILQSYKVWNKMLENRGGVLVANLIDKTVDYKELTNSSAFAC